MMTDVRLVRRSGRSGALDRRHCPAGRLHAQLRCVLAATRQGKSGSGGERDFKTISRESEGLAGTAFVLSTATGRTEIVDNVGHLWTAVERLTGKPCDPLDAELIHAMERELG
jgi:hypothetical protein